MGEAATNFSTFDPLVGYEPLRWAREFHRCKAAFRAVIGGFRGGKTWGLAEDQVHHLLKRSGGVLLVGRENYTDLKDTGLKTYQKILERMAGLVVRPFHGDDHDIIVRTADGGTARIMFKTLQDAQSLGSLELSQFHIIEAGEVKEAVFDMLCTRLNIHGHQHMGVLDFNPVSKLHWLHRRFVDDKNPDFALFRASTEDNRHNLPEGYIERLRRAKDKSWCDRFIDGHWGYGGDGEPVFETFSRDYHVMDWAPDPNLPLIGGWDPGARCPAHLIAQVDRHGALNIYGEVQGRSPGGADQFVQQWVLPYKQGHFGNLEYGTHYGDKAGRNQEGGSGKSYYDYLTHHGIDVQVSYDPKMVDIDNGLEAIRGLLNAAKGAGRGINIHHRCELLISALEGGYHYAKFDDTKFQAVKFDPPPVKDGVHDHVVDVLRYMVVNLFGVEGYRDAPDPRDLDGSPYDFDDVAASVPWAGMAL